ncbi:MAG: UTP--glucose-1-phosphate uridylyltransferase, partial [Chloroflexi bacterium]|nr:UTP--glucose-1-phosphate uridylyltransferase [Chloroflexota bacterium]
MHIRKAVIPTAGFGTRFLPATKSIPKGIITVVDKPIILYIVEGLVASGIEQIILVTSSNSKPLEDFFDRNWELEAALERSGKTALLEQVRRIADIAEFAYVRQKQPLGNGHAVLMARNLVGDEPFVMVWGDDILLGDPPVPRQLMDVAEKYDAPVLAVRRVPIEQVAKYGMVQGEPVEGRVSRALSLVEKPKKEQITSDLAQLGGYVLTPD